jgi:histidyl-tRNA synthetase
VLTVDKLKKIGQQEVSAELVAKGIKEIDFDLLFELLGAEKSNDATLEKLEKKLSDRTGIDELRELFRYVKSFGVDGEIRLMPSLSRGLAIYTGTIFEAYAKKSQISSSLAGGGRYDEIIGKFLESDKEYPAVGITFGLEPIFDTLREQNANLKEASPLKAYVVSLGQMDRALGIVKKLRESGICADANFLEKKLVKELDYANKLGVPYVIIIGENEAKEKKVQLKDMVSGEQTLMSLEDAIKKIQTS